MGTLTELEDITAIPIHRRHPFLKSYSDVNMAPKLANLYQNTQPAQNAARGEALDRMEMNDLNRVSGANHTSNADAGLHRRLSRTDARPNSYAGRKGINRDELMPSVELFGDRHDVANNGAPRRVRQEENNLDDDEGTHERKNSVAMYAEALQLKIVELQQENDRLTKDILTKDEELGMCKKTLVNYQTLLLRYSKDREHLKTKLQKSNSADNTKPLVRVGNNSPLSSSRSTNKKCWEILSTHSRILQFIQASPNSVLSFDCEDMRKVLEHAFPFWETKCSVDVPEKEWKPFVDFVFRERQPINQRCDGCRDGSCSLVFKISHDGRPYILKMMINLLNLDFTQHGDGNSLTGFLSTNFGAEYKIPLKLCSHPGILKIVHHYEGSLEHFREYMSLLVPENLDVPITMANRSTFLIIKEYPTTLMNLVVNQRDLHKEAPYGMPAQFILQVIYQLLSAVCYLQNNRVVHRDIKADNIFLDWRLRPTLADFGFARKLSNLDGSDIPWTSKNDIYAGNTRAWAPELVRYSKLEPQSLPKDLSLCHVYEKSDAFAVARMVYNLLCPLDDDRYFPRSSAERPHYADVEIPSLPSCYSEEIRHVMKQLVLDDPKQRMTAKEALLRIGVMLFGPKAGELRDSGDAGLYIQSRAMKLLTVDVKETEPDDPSFHVTVDESIILNSPWIEANFLCQITADELWNIYNEKG